jgi:putative nucleotidyltransferase with HDIG domain
MDKHNDSGVTAVEKSVIMLFSTRERISNILTVALSQSNYVIIQAVTSYLAMIKTNQFLPDMVIIDITPNNTSDVLLVNRIRKSIRTKSIPVLVIIPSVLKHFIDAAAKQAEQENADGYEIPPLYILQYPFNFAGLLIQVKTILSHSSHYGKIFKKNEMNRASEIESVSQLLFNPQISVEKKLISIEKMIHKQWAFPFTVIKALDIIRSDESCCTELAKCIETDLAASTALIKVANAVFYAKRDGRVTEVKDAVVRLGFRETNNLLACLALIELSPESRKNYGFKREEFWLHSLATALIAEKLCIQCGHTKPQFAFIAGLIHDIGKIPLDNNFEQVFGQLLDETTSGSCAFYKTEEKLLGFSHTELGHYLTSKWNFPATVVMTILYHHNPDMIMSTTIPADRMIQQSVFIANILAKVLCLGHSCDEICEEIPAQFLKELKIPAGPGTNFFDSVLKDLVILCKYLNLSPKSISIGKIPVEAVEPDMVDVIVVCNHRNVFHPIVIALRNNGFKVKTVLDFEQELYKKARVIVFIPEKGFPMDIMFFEDGNESTDAPAILKIFIFNTLQHKKNQQNMVNDVIFLDKNNLDMRFIIHTLDRFFGKVVIPVNEKIEIAENEFVKGMQS